MNVRQHYKYFLFAINSLLNSKVMLTFFIFRYPRNFDICDDESILEKEIEFTDFESTQKLLS